MHVLHSVHECCAVCCLERSVDTNDLEGTDADRGILLDARGFGYALDLRWIVEEDLVG